MKLKRIAINRAELPDEIIQRLYEKHPGLEQDLIDAFMETVIIRMRGTMFDGECWDLMNNWMKDFQELLQEKEIDNLAKDYSESSKNGFFSQDEFEDLLFGQDVTWSWSKKEKVKPYE